MATPVEIAYEVSGRSEQTWVVHCNGSGRRDLGIGERPLVSPNGRGDLEHSRGPFGSGRPRRGTPGSIRTSASSHKQ
jgi:hypothetical protein